MTDAKAAVTDAKPAEPTLLVWMDLEMTGLDPERERIIEMATLITDGELTVVAEGPELVIHQPDAILEAMLPRAVVVQVLQVTARAAVGHVAVHPLV